jgi:SAM-dependent methyltransferase
MGNLTAAAADPVKDYRELAKCSFWSRVLGNRTQVDCVDVCAGTGRWMQAFSEMVLQPRSMTASVNAVDLCGDSLAHCQERLSQIPEIEKGETHCMDAGALNSIGKTFDLATNMHGLYAVPRSILRDVVASMVTSVTPGGTAIIALGDSNSFYVKYPAALDACGVESSAVISAEDVVSVLEELSLKFECIKVDYIETTNNDDELRHYLENEAGGNCWPASDERTGKAVTSVLAPNVQKLIAEYAAGPGVHHFSQSTLALLVKAPL